MTNRSHGRRPTSNTPIREPQPLDSLLVELLFVSLLVLVALGIAVFASLAAYRLARVQD